MNLRNTEYEISINRYTDNYEQFAFNPPQTSLRGKFSPSFSNLTHLQYLDLAFNDFQESQIPLQFSNLTKLTHLDLSKSNISGSILTQFTNLSSLKYLDLSSGYGVHLSSTKWLGGLINLQVLRLNSIDLYEATSSKTYFAEHISRLSNLKDLQLSNCGISGSVFPIQEINNLSRLTFLDISNNHELNSSFPVHLANLTSLSSLYLSDCNLHGSVPYMPQLKVLGVGGNTDLNVDLTRTFERRWPKLQLIGISLTKVTGPFLNLISNVPLLESLFASDCSIQGSIPKSICKLAFLRDLILRNNNFTGRISSCITMLKHLNQLDISNNSIGGDVSLPSFISKLNLTFVNLSLNKLKVSTDQHLHFHHKHQLKELGLGSCNLTGLFPTFICNLPHLEDLYLPDNNLNGTIPSCIHKLKNLHTLDLSYNNLQGPLPVLRQYVESYNLAHNKFNGEISMESGKSLSTSFYLFLSDNELTGSIPISMCSKEPGVRTNIQYLDLSNNKLSGFIPPTIGYCNFLEYLNLGTNNLTGNVPQELEQIKNLLFLQLNDNNLNGDPLHFISKLHELEVLNLENNNFGGSISNVFGSLNNLKILSLSSNNFNGSVPKEILNLHQLQVFDLSRNNLTGLLPREIGNLITLRSRSNDTSKLTGGAYLVDLHLQMVSKGIIQFQKLYTYSSGIDLSSNNLEGEIPEEIGLLKGLYMLNLSHNRLLGKIPQTIGSMNGLESLDLSFNKLSGFIPPSFASMDFLGYLNLSYNNLSGIIPRGPHFDTLGGDSSAYVNNSFLCGYPTENVCEGDQSSNTSDTYLPSGADGNDTNDKWYLYGAVALGIIVGFWGLFFCLLLKKDKWWFGYWRFIDNISVKIVNFFLSD
ncbi:LRR receptor-like serine/threonine-protein kinase GSO1 [Papaver somniferum]|uniref:LRR receptor-like serine/threonine-protein kinase GSO1 n=1 Tax=Papaver somniferum TaxID=3469 RepID=UPI000E6F4780|nr:LRR receptor-like serine/threonine-protein kinase GSO1 [Papaver somniferum]